MEAKKTSHHENLLGTNSLIVRQNRFDSEGGLHAKINGRKHSVVNYSLFGLAIQSEEEIAVDSYVQDIELFCSNQNVATLTFLVKRVKRADSGFEIGMEAVNSTLPLETILRLKDFSTLINTLNEKQHHYNSLPAEYKLALQDLAARFENFEKYVLDFMKVEFSNGRDFTESRDALVDIVSTQLKAELDDSLVRMVTAFQDRENEDHRLAFSYFREKMGKFMFQSPFTKRSYEKPRGYAGDYLMMTQIYANDSHANNLFGSCMEKAIQQFGEPSAVRNRSGYLSRKILSKIKETSGKLSFLSVASGPAEEVRLAVKDLNQADLDRCTFYLLDQDEGALQFAQKTILEFALSVNKKVTLKLMNRGIKEILVMGLEQYKFDMIYSAGLFDYFTDVVASKACKVLFKHLEKAGMLIIGNFNVKTTNWFGMMAFFDWSLVLRSEQDFLRLFKMESSQIMVESEDNNINLFCCITST